MSVLLAAYSEANRPLDESAIRVGITPTWLDSLPRYVGIVVFGAKHRSNDRMLRPLPRKDQDRSFEASMRSPHQGDLGPIGRSGITAGAAGFCGV
jgi:hypothetical protein